MSEWYEIDAAWDANGYASDALLKLGETSEWCDLMGEVSRSTHATAEEAYDGMANALRCYLESLDNVGFAAWMEGGQASQDVTGSAERVTKQAELLHDTREKLEADVREEVGHYFAWQKKRDQFANKIVEWLDRQAAITERETLHSHPMCVGSDACPALNRPMARIAELCDQVDELMMERDNLRIYRDTWEHTAHLHEGDIERLVEERDQWKDAFEDSERMRLAMVVGEEIAGRL